LVARKDLHCVSQLNTKKFLIPTAEFLLICKTYNFFQVVEYVKSHDGYIDNILHHFGTSAIMDMLMRLITSMESTECRNSCIMVRQSWLCKIFHRFVTVSARLLLFWLLLLVLFSVVTVSVRLLLFWLLLSALLSLMSIVIICSYFVKLIWLVLHSVTVRDYWGISSPLHNIVRMHP